MDFLEISLVASLDEAPRKQAAVAEFVRSLGLQVPTDSQSKTQQVVRQLVTQRLAAG